MQITGAEIQGTLVGLGALLASGMTGVAASRLLNAWARTPGRIAGSLERGAEELGKLRTALESNNAVQAMVASQGETLKAVLEKVVLIGEQREEIGRELRIMSRKIEVLGYGAKEEEQI